MRRPSALLRSVAPLAGALITGGCVSTGDVEALHKHLNEVEKKVDAASKTASSRDEVQKLNENLSKQATTLLRSNAELGSKFDELVREMQSLAGKLEESNRRLREVSQQMAETQARSGAGAPGRAARPPRPSSSRAFLERPPFRRRVRRAPRSLHPPRTSSPSRRRITSAGSSTSPGRASPSTPRPTRRPTCRTTLSTGRESAGPRKRSPARRSPPGSASSACIPTATGRPPHT